MSKKANDALRAMYSEKLTELFTELGEDVLRVGSGEIAFPVVDSEGNDNWVTLTIKIPTGSRDGDPYDGYSLAEEYTMKVKAAAEKKAKAEKAKAEKIKRDAEYRAKQKTNRERAEKA